MISCLFEPSRLRGSIRNIVVKKTKAAPYGAATFLLLSTSLKTNYQ
jgi:hypothetical protein